MILSIVLLILFIFQIVCILSMINEKDSSKVAYIICSILVFFVIGCIDAILIKE